MVILGLDLERDVREKFFGLKLWCCFLVFCCVGNWWEFVCILFVVLSVFVKKFLYFFVKEM